MSKGGGERVARVERKSRETRLEAEVALEGGERVEVSTGLPFLDHLVEQIARYGAFDLRLAGAGDIQVDPHHLCDGAREGITRFAAAYAPLDESLARVVVDLGRRPFLSYNLPLRGRVGSLESEVLEEFWRAFSIHLGATIHVDLIRGRNRHHIAESAAKALGLALREAMSRGGRGIPSSKGLLG